VFKGGKVLRIAYKGNRYSEDLDFSGPANVALTKEIWQGLQCDLCDFFVNAEIRKGNR